MHAVSTLVTPLSLHGVAVAPVTDRDLMGLETMVLQAVWGATRLSRAKEVVFVVLTQGHRISPVMHTRYERVLWMTRIARTPGPVQVLVQAIWESGLRPPTTGPFGRALHVVRLLGWQPLEGWWSWVVPGQTEPLHLVQEPMRQIQHRVRDSLRCHAMRGLEARRPATYGGLGDGVDGEACRAALRVASTELEASLLRGLLAGALWTAARVRGHNMRATSSCPGCGSQHEDEAHVLWDCPSWETARAGWRAWVLQAAERLQLGPPTGWPACLRRAGLLPLALSAGADRRQVDEFLYRLYGMYLAVLAAGGARVGRGPLPAAPGAGRQGGIPVAGPERSPAAAAGGTGNATPPGRPAGVALGAGVRPGPGPLGSGPPMAGRPRGRHLGRAGPGLRDVPGPGPAGVPPPSVVGDAPPARRARASPAAGRTAVAAPHGCRAPPAGGSQ